MAPHSEAGVELLDSKAILIKPTNLRPWPPTESADVSVAVETTFLAPLTLIVSGEGSLVPRKDTKKKDPAPETKECAHCPAPDGQHGVAVKACIRCKAAFYCGRACQTAHWRAGHKEFCVTPGECVPSLPPEGPLRVSSINGPKDTPLDRAGECAICLDGRWREVGAAASGGRVTETELVGGRVKGPGWRASPKRTPAAGERRLSAAGRESKTGSKRAGMSLKAESTGSRMAWTPS